MPAADPKAGLYVHLPFCSAICPYCDFAVTTGGSDARRAFVDGLVREIGAARHAELPFDTVYFGGGTPSALAAGQLEEIVGALRHVYSIDGAARWALEANPEDVDDRSLSAWRRLGFATVSLGVQAFTDDRLRFLGRRHSATQAVRAVEAALASDVETVSIDLIYGLPEDGAASWRKELETATGLGPNHISCYQLTVHGGTPFARMEAAGRLTQLAEEGQAELFHLTHELLDERGYPGYEVSNFAAEERHRSRHNHKYWTHQPYLGLGPSAHSFRGRRRWWNLSAVPSYLEAIGAGAWPVAGSEELDDEALALERLMLGFRIREGVDLDEIERRHRVSIAEPNRELIARWIADGFVLPEGCRLVPTLRGLAAADALAADLEIVADRRS